MKSDPFKDHPKLAVESHLTAIAGLTAALDMFASAPDLQDNHKRAIGALADAIKERHDALWDLLFESGIPAD